MISISTNQDKKPFLSIFHRSCAKTPPIWLMRQAGRYLPEYRKLRETAKDFLTCCYTPTLASEITLQPLRRFDLDAAIIFSDILVIPDALGVKVTFTEKLGPQIATLSTEKEVGALQWDKNHLNSVYEAIEQTAKGLPTHVTLIGFAGAPWTLAAYMLEGKSTEQFIKARSWAYQNSKGFTALMSLLEEKIIEHLSQQIKAGCEAVQIFDSWAGVLSADEIKVWSIAPLTRITAALKKAFPHVPVLLFPRGAGSHYPDYIVSCGADAISVDQYTPLPMLAANKNTVLQGNLDPLLLASHLPEALASAKKIMDGMKGKPFIFNLGHGVLPFTPPEHVQALVTCVKEYNA
jgi:uroporphyrinogen decarboxylase